MKSAVKYSFNEILESKIGTGGEDADYDEKLRETFYSPLFLARFISGILSCPPWKLLKPTRGSEFLTSSLIKVAKGKNSKNSSFVCHSVVQTFFIIISNNYITMKYNMQKMEKKMLDVKHF